MQIYMNLKGLFIAVSAVTIVLQLFYLQKFAIIKSKKMKKGILNNRNRLKKIVDKDYITKAEATIFYPCTDISMPKLVEKVSKWQPVHDDQTSFVFSAYFVHESRTIVVISIRKQEEAKTYFCQYWYKRGNQYALSFQRHARIIVLPFTHGRPYAAEMFECKVPRYDPPPSYVSIVDINCTTPKNLLFVQHVNKPERVIRNFTVCLSPVFGDPNIYRFVEWVELNKMLGADRFYIYNYTSNVKFRKLLEFYSNSGIINIVQWNLPEINTGANVSKPISIHYQGQIAALNDCLYRNKYESEYIVNVDMDEFIIPHMENDTTWHHMFTHLDPNQTVYIVCNTFFRKTWKIPNIEISNKTFVAEYDLITIQMLQHDEKVFPPERRSKYFARTSRVSSLMIHTVNISEYKLPVPVNISYLHHYREKNYKKNLKPMKAIDVTVPKKYGNALVRNVVTVWSELNSFFAN